MPGQRFRNTTQRAEVLDEVRRSQSHLTAGEIFERVRTARPPHRLRHGLPDAAPAGGARADPGIDVRGSASRYDGRVERHDHVHCLECGVLLDVDVPVALMALHVAAEQSGFDVNSHHTVFPAPPRVQGAESGRREIGNGHGAEWRRVDPRSATTSN